MRFVLIAVSSALCLALLSGVRASAYPGYCEVEIINSMQNDVNVHGTFADGRPLTPFRMQPHETPHYISLQDHGYCQSGMHLMIAAIQSPHNTMIYNAWTRPGSTVRLVPR